jgi:aspartate aminotransferase-like enzyme
MIVDAVSAFGALPLDLSAQPEIDAVGFTSNKCLEGVPGMAFAVARIDRVEACEGNAGSWSLDLSSIYAHALRAGWGAFRFTPPAQVLNAFNVALDLFDAEGGQPARLARYTVEYARAVRRRARVRADTVSAPDVQGRSSSTCTRRSIRRGICSALSTRCSARRADQQLLQHRAAELSRGLHRRDHTDRYGVAVTAMGEALGDLGIACKAA